MRKVFLDFVIPVILLMLSLLLIYVLVGDTIDDTVISAETLFMPFISYYPTESDTDYFVKMFLSSDHSWFFVSFVTHLFSRVLPVLMNNHPQDFYLAHGWILLFLIFYIQSLCQSLNLAKYFKYKFAVLIAFFVSMPFLLQNLQSANFLWALFNDTWFFCYILNSVFPILLFVILEKAYVTMGEIIPPPPEKSKINFPFIEVLILIFLTGIGHELYRFVLCGSFILGLIFHKIVFKTHFKTNKIWYFLSYLLLMSCFLFFLSTWQSWNNLILSQCQQSFSLISAFQYFFEFVLGKNILVIFFILLFGVLNFFISEDKEMVKRLAIVTVSGLLSILLFNFIIIAVSGESVDISQHCGIIYSTKTVFLYLFFSNIGFGVVHYSEKYKNLVCIVLYAFLTFSICFFCYYRTFHTFSSSIISEQNRINQYLIEKAYDVYGKTHNIIYATYSDSTVDNYAIAYLKYWYGGNDKDYKIKYICKPSDSFEKCQKKFIKTLYKKSGCLITKQELMETDFSDLQGYNERKRKGKIYVDFFND